jgi:hypothetical protein
MKNLNVKVGDLAFVVTARHQYDGEKIISVGRKYIKTSSGYKFELNGYGEFGYRLYESKEAYLNSLKCIEIKREIENRLRSDIQLETLSQIIELLNTAQND